MLSSSPLPYCLLLLPGELVLSFCCCCFFPGGGRREEGNSDSVPEEGWVNLRDRIREGREGYSVRQGDKTLHILLEYLSREKPRGASEGATRARGRRAMESRGPG